MAQANDWRRVELFFLGFVTLAEGMCLILTLGGWAPALSLEFVRWRLRARRKDG